MTVQRPGGDGKLHPRTACFSPKLLWKSLIRIASAPTPLTLLLWSFRPNIWSDSLARKFPGALVADDTRTPVIGVLWVYGRLRVNFSPCCQAIADKLARMDTQFTEVGLGDPR